MKQTFEKINEGKIKWTFEKEEVDYEDKEFGKLGKSFNTGYIVFDNKEKAIAVLDRDLKEVEAFIKQYQDEMSKNEHNLDKFTDLKELIHKVAELHTDFKNINTDKIYGLYNSDPKRYTKLYQEFNKSKDYIKDELAYLSKEFQKMQNYNIAKKNLEFNNEQWLKIKEQREELNKL
jgi:prefoldin subunit 5